MKNTLNGNDGRSDTAEEKISEFEDRTMETSQNSKKKIFKINFKSSVRFEALQTA